MLNDQEQIRTLLHVFQDGYTRRDLSILDNFLELFTGDIECIGTNGVKPGVDEWYLTRDTARELVNGDWEYWGDLRLDVASASIHTRGEVGWIATTATVTKVFGTENYSKFLEFITKFIADSPQSAERKLLYILRGGANTLYELRRSEKFIWPLRFTAVVVREKEGWKFAQIHFSFPTVYFPDVRVDDDILNA